MGRKTKMNSITSPELLAQVNPSNNHEHDLIMRGGKLWDARLK